MRSNSLEIRLSYDVIFSTFYNLRKKIRYCMFAFSRLADDVCWSFVMLGTAKAKVLSFFFRVCFRTFSFHALFETAKTNV